MSQQVNLCNPVFLKQQIYFSLAAMLQALILIMVGAGLFCAYASYQVKQLAAQSAESEKRFTVEQARLANYVAQLAPQQSAEALGAELSDAQAKAAAKRELIETLKSGVIGNTKGYSEYMRAFARQSMSGLWLTGFDITGDAAQMSMSGGVINPELVPAYIQRLGGETVMKGKSFAALQMRQPKTDAGKHYVEFSLQSAEVEEAKK